MGRRPTRRPPPQARRPTPRAWRKPWSPRHPSHLRPGAAQRPAVVPALPGWAPGSPRRWTGFPHRPRGWSCAGSTRAARRTGPGRGRSRTGRHCRPPAFPRPRHRPALPPTRGARPRRPPESCHLDRPAPRRTEGRDLGLGMVLGGGIRGSAGLRRCRSAAWMASRHRARLPSRAPRFRTGRPAPSPLRPRARTGPTLRIEPALPDGNSDGHDDHRAPVRADVPPYFPNFTSNPPKMTFVYLSGRG